MKEVGEHTELLLSLSRAVIASTRMAFSLGRHINTEWKRLEIIHEHHGTDLPYSNF